MGNETGAISRRRKPLPVELVLEIFGWADIRIPVFAIKPSISFRVFSFGGSPGSLVRKPWFSTGLLRPSVLKPRPALQLTTFSREQGFVPYPEVCMLSEGNSKLPLTYSQFQGVWFDIAVTQVQHTNKEPQIQRRDGENGSLLVWESHKNTLSSSLRRYGVEFGPNHEIWSHLTDEGNDCITVYGCVMFPAWACVGDNAVLKITKAFMPTHICRPPGQF